MIENKRISAIIRKMILEVISQSELEPSGTKLQQDIDLLKNYTLIETKIISGANTWKFEFKTQDESYLSHAFIVQYPNGVCKMRLEVDWKVTTKHNTVGAGKDFVMVFGPFQSYDEMVTELNRKLKNHPMIGSNLYKDNNDFQLDNEIVTLLKRLKENIAEIHSLNHPSLKTLERTYELIKDIPDDEGLAKFADENFKGWLLKQGMIYKLQNLDKIPYYRSLRTNFHHFEVKNKV